MPFLLLAFVSGFISLKYLGSFSPVLYRVLRVAPFDLVSLCDFFPCHTDDSGASEEDTCHSPFLVPSLYTTNIIESCISVPVPTAIHECLEGPDI